MELNELIEKIDDLSIDFPRSHHLLENDVLARNEVKMMLVRGEFMRLNIHFAFDILSKRSDKRSVDFVVSMLKRAIEADETAEIDMKKCSSAPTNPAP